jgi:hypothetical protein
MADVLVGRLVPAMVIEVFFGPPITPLAVVTWITEGGGITGVLLSVPPFLQEKKIPVKNRRVKNVVVILIDNFFCLLLNMQFSARLLIKGYKKNYLKKYGIWQYEHL